MLRLRQAVTRGSEVLALKNMSLDLGDLAMPMMVVRVTGLAA